MLHLDKDLYRLCHSTFQFTNVGGGKDIDFAINMYKPLIFPAMHGRGGEGQQRENAPRLEELQISAENPTPTAVVIGVDESYNLTVSGRLASLSAKTYAGVLRGLETFSQLVLYVMCTFYPNANVIIACLLFLLRHGYYTTGRLII